MPWYAQRNTAFRLCETEKGTFNKKALNPEFQKTSAQYTVLTTKQITNVIAEAPALH